MALAYPKSFNIYIYIYIYIYGIKKKIKKICLKAFDSVQKIILIWSHSIQLYEFAPKLNYCPSFHMFFIYVKIRRFSAPLQKAQRQTFLPAG
jgi:hypothetical protein